MNRKLALAGRAAGIALGYFLAFVLAVFLTVSLMVKGDEISAPNLVGMPLPKAYEAAARKGVFLKKVVGDFGGSYAPNTVVSQFPAPATSVKEKSVLKIFVSSEVGQTIVPKLIGLGQKESEALLKQGKLKRGNAAYLSAAGVVPDSVISQSPPAGSRAAEGAAVDLLFSKGAENPSFIMPDLIGKEAAKVLVFFESRGLRIAKIEEVPYYGLKPGIIVKQFPSPGFEISVKNQIGIQVSQ